MTEYSDLLLIFLLEPRKPEMYRERMDVNVKEKRRIVIDLLPVEKDSKMGQLRVVEDAPPLLSARE